MLRKIIEKALLLKNVEKEKEVVIEISNTTVFNLHMFEMIVLLLYNFFLLYQRSEQEVTTFVKNSYNEILDIIITEIEIALYNYTVLYNEELESLIELCNKDETLLVLVIQNNVNKKLKELVERKLENGHINLKHIIT